MVKLKKLVDTEKAMEKFIADYRIPLNVSLRHCKIGGVASSEKDGRGSNPYSRLRRGGYKNPHRANNEELPWAFPIGSYLVCHQYV